MNMLTITRVSVPVCGGNKTLDLIGELVAANEDAVFRAVYITTKSAINLLT